MTMPKTPNFGDWIYKGTKPLGKVSKLIEVLVSGDIYYLVYCDDKHHNGRWVKLGSSGKWQSCQNPKTI